MAPFLLQKHINRRKRVKRRLCGFYYRTSACAHPQLLLACVALCDGL